MVVFLVRFHIMYLFLKIYLEVPMKKRKVYRNSLRFRLILAFVITSILPIIVLNLFSYYNTSGIVRENVSELTDINLKQTKSSLDVWLDSYEDILFQIYTDDSIVELVEKINQGKDVSVSKNQLRRTLRGLFYTKDYVKSISVITDDGTVVFYDMLTGSTTQNSWLGGLSLSQEDLYEEISSDNETHIFSTRKAGNFAGEDHYLFHLGHRMINYKKVGERIGVVLVSIDEKMLKEICNGNNDLETSFNFIVSDDGSVVSYIEDETLGKQVEGWKPGEEDNRAACEGFLQGQGVSADDGLLAINVIHDEKLGWNIVNVSNQGLVLGRLQGQQKLMILVLTVSLVMLTVVIFVLTRSLTGALEEMVRVMRAAGKGTLTARVDIDRKMPEEVETIAVQFNHMLEKLGKSMEKEKEANLRQKNAEIAALEAQINPHFLYNTLDTINWMAIDRDEYEISNSISALAQILRYGIDNSNAIVTVKEEGEWLRKYLFLQQTRLKNKFECEIHIEPEVLNKPLHKLLLQPFVENAIIHGFDGVSRTYRLEVSIYAINEDALGAEIYDNGRGIPASMTEAFNQGIFSRTEEKKHIGMANAFQRIKMYYGDKASVTVESVEGEFTRIHIQIPYMGGWDNENHRG